MEQLDFQHLLQQGIPSMELIVTKAPGQQATFCHAVQVAWLSL